MFTYVYTTLICMMLLLATEVVSVEVSEADKLASQVDAFPEEPYENGKVVDEGLVNEDKRTADFTVEEANNEELLNNETTQETGVSEWHMEDKEIYTEDAFPEESIYDEPVEEDSIYAVMDKPHKYVSENIEWLVTKVDRFFADDELYRYTTDSYVQLSGDTLFEENGEIGFDVKFRTRVDLPGTKRRFKLILNKDPTEKQDPRERSVDGTPGAAVQESDLFGSIQRERILRDWKFRPSVGVKVTLPLEPFVKARFTRIYPLQHWFLRADQNFYWFEDDGFGSDSTVEFDRPAGQNHLFRASSFARWTEETNYFELSQIFTLFHTLTPKHKMSYQIGAYGQTSPTWFMTDYLLVVRYRQNLHKEWFFFEVRPQVLYSKENDWDDELSLLLRLDLLFGKKYL